MHLRNPYATQPDFVGLARRYPPLRPHVFLTHSGPTIDFKNVSAQRRLTEALLYLDFNITLKLPGNRLCPPVPNRLNYVLWIQDIITMSGLDDGVVRGIDVGTGASVIYPLLACRLEPRWTFIATDIDKDSLLSAQENVKYNGLSDRIVIVESSSNGSILGPLEGSVEIPFHFTMCNPPFYADMEEVAGLAEVKEYAPTAVCTGSENEMVTPGGETFFVSRMLIESLHYKMQCRWYTSMLGKMSSLPLIVDLLREHRVDNYAITEFIQGQTRRWGIAWSFGTRRLPDSLTRITNPTLQNIMPSRTTLYQQVPNVQSLEFLYTILLRVLGTIEGVDVAPELTNPDKAGAPSVIVTGTEVTWSRSARRKKMFGQLPKAPQGSPIMECRIRCVDGPCLIVEKQRVSGLRLVYQWVWGGDHRIFESFANHVSRKVTATADAR